MPQLVSQCSKCGCSFSWNSDYQKAPLCPRCGYDTIYGGKRNKVGQVTVRDGVPMGRAGGARSGWLADLFLPKWRRSNPAVRKKAVAAIGDAQVLTEMAMTDPDADVCKAAMGKLPQPAVAVVARTSASKSNQLVAVSSLTQEELLEAIARDTSLSLDVRRCAAERLAAKDPSLLAAVEEQERVEEASRAAKPEVQGDVCARNAKAEAGVAVFLGPRCFERRDEALRAGEWRGPSVCAATLAALKQAYPNGQCGSCKGYHSMPWTVHYTFYLPGRRGQRSTADEMQAWAKQFADEISKRDTIECLFMSAVDWTLDVSDSSGWFVESTRATTEWVCWTGQFAEQAYLSLGGTLPGESPR